MALSKLTFDLFPPEKLADDELDGLVEVLNKAVTEAEDTSAWVAVSSKELVSNDGTFVLRTYLGFQPDVVGVGIDTPDGVVYIDKSNITFEAMIDIGTLFAYKYKINKAYWHLFGQMATVYTNQIHPNAKRLELKAGDFYKKEEENG